MDTQISDQVTPATETTCSAKSVLCVDLDGTLISGDVLWECILSLSKTNPLCLFLMPYWLLRGKANLKRRLARRAGINVANLPYRPEVLRFLRSERQAGRKLVLVTASEEELADSVAHYLGIFDRVYGSDGKDNLKGKTKAGFLRREFADTGFEYIGNSSADLKVWRVAKAGYVVGDESLCQQASAVTEIRGVFPAPRAAMTTWFHALRGHHWFKNLLLFLPLALAHKIHLHTIIPTVLGFLLFGMCASAIYVLNDLLDLHSDRDHPWKRKRPIAAGEISIPEGLFIAVGLLVFVLPCSFLLNRNFGFLMAGYAALTMWYSVHLKKIVLLDAFVLSSFYSIRILGGALITSVPLSHWFLVFSLFFFLSLAMAKRYSELVHANELVESGQSGRGYIGHDRDVLMSFGVASSFSAVVVFSLYVHSPEVLALYRMPEPLLLLAPIVLYWLSRVWLKAHRGELHDDPITLAMRDPASYAVAAASIIVIAISMVAPR